MLRLFCIFVFHGDGKLINKKSIVVAAIFTALIVIAVAAIFLFQSSSFTSEEPTSETTNNKSAEGSGGAFGRSSKISTTQSEVQHETGLLEDKLSFEEIKDRANRGVASAQRRLAQIYESCFAYSLNPVTHLATLDDLAQVNPDSKTGIELLKKRQALLCDGIDSGAPIPQEAYKLWTEQAARNGDVASKLKIRARSSAPLSAGDINSLADEALASGDPQALLELSEIMGRPLSDPPSGRFESLSGSASAGYAWSIAACRAGVACGKGSYVMDSICMNTGSCNHSNYEAFVMTELVPSAQKKHIYRMINSINKMRNP